MLGNGKKFSFIVYSLHKFRKIRNKQDILGFAVSANTVQLSSTAQLFSYGQAQVARQLEQLPLVERLHAGRLRQLLVAGTFATALAAGLSGHVQAQEAFPDAGLETPAVVGLLTKRTSSFSSAATQDAAAKEAMIIAGQIAPNPDRYNKLMLEVLAISGLESPRSTGVSPTRETTATGDLEFDARWHNSLMRSSVAAVRHAVTLYTAHAAEYDQNSELWSPSAEKVAAVERLVADSKMVNTAVRNFFVEYGKTLAAGYNTAAWDVEVALLTDPITTGKVLKQDTSGKRLLQP